MGGVLRLFAKGVSVLYVFVAYVLFLFSLVYLVGFVTNRYAPASIDSGVSLPLRDALRTNLLLLALFVLQHSGMAREGFKRVWTKIIPLHLERATYLIATALTLAVIFRYWEPMPERVWKFEHPGALVAGQLLSWSGAFLIVLSAAVWSHAEFTGIRQLVCYLRDRPFEPETFQERGVYRWVRHPMMLGVILWLWSTPSMSRGRLLFAAFMTAYIALAIRWEERDLVRKHGEAYRAYQRRVRALAPWRRRGG